MSASDDQENETGSRIRAAAERDQFGAREVCLER